MTAFETVARGAFRSGVPRESLTSALAGPTARRCQFAARLEAVPADLDPRGGSKRVVDGARLHPAGRACTGAPQKPMYRLRRAVTAEVL